MIRTIMGDIVPDQLGICDFHDHLIRSGGAEINITMDYLMDSLHAAAEELDDFIHAGGGAMVCMDPIGCGRDVAKMLELAKMFAGRAHLIMCTGFHKGTLYDQRHHWLMTSREEQAVDLIAAEIETGMDIHSYNGPIVERVEAKAGIIKAGASYQAILPFEQKALRIAALVQRRTGAPISVHTQQGTMGSEIIAILRKADANLEKVVLCHVQRIPDFHYLASLMDMGANLSFDGIDRPEWGTDEILAKLIFRLIEAGYGEKIVLAMDAGRNTFQKGYMQEKDQVAKGISYLLTSFVPLLFSLGLAQPAVDRLLVHNPRRILDIR